MVPLLQVNNLSISFEQDKKLVPVVKDISLNIHPGKFTAIVGESGSGKSVTALAMLQLLPAQAVVSGKLLFSEDGKSQTDLATAPSKEIKNLRGNKIAMIFQEPMTSLNPVFTCGFQVMESLRLHKKLSRKEARQKTIELFEQVELPAPAAMLDRYPHQISGGQKQRVMIAMAMSCNPTLLIADEPTTALDVRVQKNILQLLKKLQLQQQMSVLFITHDLGLVAAFADEVLVMHKGLIVEQGASRVVLQNPQHSYTKALLACKPQQTSKGKRLPVVTDFIKEGINVDSDLAQILLPIQQPVVTDNIVLKVENLKVYFPAEKNMFGKALSFYKAVDEVSFSVREGETVGLVGESGCGKTTLGRSILQLVKPTEGKIWLHEKEIQSMDPAALRHLRKDLQIIFQDPYGSLNPRITIGDAILEPLMVHGLHQNKKERKEKVIQLLEQVSLNGDFYKRYPHQFSGGQRQRICIARALALEPSFLIFDESVSALDVSVQAQVLNLINDLKQGYRFTSIFISHDLSVVHYISDRILVMHKGKIVEEGTADEIMYRPTEPYTKALIEAIP
ncbi:MAG: ABC transporter ATP-binding protein [Gloeobacteraceae cyanobacterium ES-bin-316]|nr:ABC transporter ATP-binding protein [Ferruginibacter sp.]